MGNLATVKTAKTLATMDVDSGLTLKAINAKLRMESVLFDIFENLSGEVLANGKQMVSVPDAIFLKLEAVPTGANTVTVPFLKALSGDATIGAYTPGSEFTQSLLYCTFRYNEYGIAVASENYGINKNEMSMYGVFEQIQPQISEYMKEYRGMRIRQALLQTCDEVVAGLSSVDFHFNSNWFICNAGTQPTYDSTVGATGSSSFVENICDALDAAASGTNGVDANIDLNYLYALDYYASNVLKIEPIMIDGVPSRIVTLPARQVQVLKKSNLALGDNVHTLMTSKDGDKINYTGYVARVGSLVIVEDPRSPTVQKTGANGSWALSCQYMRPGNDDDRKTYFTQDNAENFDIGFCVGKAAVCEWEVTPVHFEVEVQNYRRYQGTGAFGESGIQLVEYDYDAGWAGTDNNRLNRGSVVLAFSIPTITA